MFDLPEDLWRLVFQQLRQPDHAWNLPQRGGEACDLANVSLTSKAFREFARPALYHTFDFRDYRPVSIKKLLTTLCLHPTYCGLVRTLRIEEWNDDGDDEDADDEIDEDLEESDDEYESASDRTPTAQDDKAPNVELIKLYERVISQLCLPQKVLRDLQAGVLRGLDRAELALLLCMCTKIQKLSFHSEYRPQESLVAAIIRASVASHDRSASAPSDNPTTPLPFGRLQEIDICHDNIDSATPISEISSALRFPTLKMMQLGGITCKSRANFSGITSTVQQLCLYDVLLNAHGLDKLLTACPLIKKLSIKDWHTSDSESGIDYAAFGEVLRRCGTELEYLKLELKGRRSSAPPRRGLPVGQMTTLKSLRYLELPFDALFGDSEESNSEIDGADWGQIGEEDCLINILPHSLKTLRIFGSHYEEESNMQDTQLCMLMMDPSFSALTTVRMNRNTRMHFISEEFRAHGWQSIHNNTFRQLFKRTWNMDTQPLE